MIKVSLSPHGQGFAVKFHHPLTDKLTRTTCATRDRTKADAIRIDLESLCNDKNMHGDVDPAQLAGYEPRALEIFYRKPVEPSPITPGSLSPAEIHALIGGTLDSELAEELKVAKQRVREQDRVIEKLQTELKVLRPALAAAQAELEQLRQETNRHVHAKLQEARDRFEEQYKRAGLKARTVQNVLHAVDSFLAKIKPDTLLASVTTNDIDGWLLDMKREDGSTISAVTKRHRKAYLGVFLKWAAKRYGLSQNPMLDADRINGSTNHTIHAITRLADLQGLHDALKPEPYWRAWVLVATLAGLRWAEQQYLRWEDVDLDAGLIYVRNHKFHQVKTGRERKVAIERTTLLPALQEHAQAKAHEIWVFPTLVEPGVTERRLTPPGVWSHNAVWADSWAAVVTRRGLTGAAAEYTQREWRHTFGTVLAMCGFNALQISRMMGNSPQVADKHYIAEAAHSTKWPYQF